MGKAESDSEFEMPFPFEFTIEQVTPVSAQTKNNAAKKRWIEMVSQYAKKAIDSVREQYFLDNRALCVTIYYFPDSKMQGDVDNIVKPILDGMISVAYPDDKLIERCVVQKFEPGGMHIFSSPSQTLEAAIGTEKPCLYIRLEDDPVSRSAS